MIRVTVTGGTVREFPAVGRFSTEDVFNNLCIHDERGTLLAVFAQDQWISVEVGNGTEALG